MGRKRGVKKALKKAAVKATEKAVEKPVEKVEVTIKSKVLGEAPKEHNFVLKDGKKIASVYQLIDEFENMSEDVFRHHVNDLRNDFSTWLEDVFDEKNLADEMRHIQDKFGAQRRLMRKMIDELLK